MTEFWYNDNKYGTTIIVSRIVILLDLFILLSYCYILLFVCIVETIMVCWWSYRVTDLRTWHGFILPTKVFEYRHCFALFSTRVCINMEMMRCIWLCGVHILLCNILHQGSSWELSSFTANNIEILDQMCVLTADELLQGYLLISNL